MENESPKVAKDYYGLILPLGTSYEPLVLSILTLKPKKILFLHTSKTEALIDPVVENCALKTSDYRKRQVDEANPLQIYEKIKEAYIEWERGGLIALDFTGGTKSMAGGSAMAGAIIGADLFYIGNRNYLTDFRKPKPGSEYLCAIPNPYIGFGDLEAVKALSLYEKMDYAGAALIFKDLQ